MNIRHTVIPAAGFGTRMLPAAKAVPKELLPILDRPTLQYVIEEAADAGVSEVVLVTSATKKAIEQHFQPMPELQDRLKASGKEDLLRSVNELIGKIRMHPVFQHEQRGLGHAVLQARDAVEGSPFLCQLGDTIFSGDVGPATQLVEAYRALGTSIIGLEQVPAEKVSRYGIVGGETIRDGVLKLNALVEKPSPQSAPSNYAIAARYILTPTIFQCLDETKPGKGGEIQLTDALQLLLQREPIHGIVLRAKRHDIGNPVDWLKTNLTFAKRDAELWKQIEPLVRSLLQ